MMAKGSTLGKILNDARKDTPEPPEPHGKKAVELQIGIRIPVGGKKPGKGDDMSPLKKATPTEIPPYLRSKQQAKPAPAKKKKPVSKRSR
jgi:hypothetical protein